LLNRIEKRPKSVRVPEVNDESVNVKVGRDKIGVFPGKVIGFFHKADGFLAHFWQFVPF
jgi:hypothetical protein